MRQFIPDCLQDGKAAHTGIENANGLLWIISCKHQGNCITVGDVSVWAQFNTKQTLPAKTRRGFSYALILIFNSIKKSKMFSDYNYTALPFHEDKTQHCLACFATGNTHRKLDP